MCGIAGIVGNNTQEFKMDAMLQSQKHRGPDYTGKWVSQDKKVILGHNRLSIIDLSEGSNQPFHSNDGRYSIVFNGEIYNYIELREKYLSDFQFITKGDTEVLLNLYIKYGVDCLEKLIGMFSFFIWDSELKKGFGTRDRLGIKPFYYIQNFDGNRFIFSSEIKAIHAYGFPKVADDATWAEYLASGRYNHSANTFWEGIQSLEAAHFIQVENENISITKYYSLFDKTGNDYDLRSIEDVSEEYFAILQDSIKLRFRADVPVGINISGGLDSSALLAMVNKVQGEDSTVKAFSFYTNDEQYDELPWVQEMISKTHHSLEPVLLTAAMIPNLAQNMQLIQDEPYGGIPTLAYSKIFESARNQGILVLLDGQGMDEQWAGYDYYRTTGSEISKSVIQGSKSSPFAISTLEEDFINSQRPAQYESPYNDELRNLQFRDAYYTKIPRALRFNDRVSMMHSTELREPFLDHRLFEIAFRQPISFKIKGDQGKFFMRNLLQSMLPGKLVEAPKRPLQTPQREWLKDDLKDWATEHIHSAIQRKPEWLNKQEVLKSWNDFLAGKSDNSFYIWQWISISLMEL